jgi:hypothetical protein
VQNKIDHSGLAATVFTVRPVRTVLTSAGTRRRDPVQSDRRDHDVDGQTGQFFFNKNMTIVDLTAVEHIQWPETSMFLEFE